MNDPAEESELALIERIRSQAKTDGPQSRHVALGIGDDCAILRPPSGSEIVVTTDFSLEGRHFRRDWHSPESAGHRCLARGLSDLAAMGATPVGAFLSLALPARTPRAWTDGFLVGLLALAERFSVPLAGGDTAESPSNDILADIVLVGTAPRCQALRRSGARPGDLVYVTGTLGGAVAELDRISTGALRSIHQAEPGEHPQLFPEPRLALGQALRKRHLATACMDLSDGLSSDLAKLCRASSVGAEILAGGLPIHPQATLDRALNGGEDYELLFTARPATRLPRRIAGARITPIGRITPADAGLILLGTDGQRSTLRPGGWEHFK